ncbi:splicing factor [Coemansia sp. RSA 1358]|uniref:Splicing factor n=1 Tax=Coemansia umbellata TaxID=1424467 RepID=A0ABQ8PJW5_9FUNG|nr:splicing factor [Coemansia umbellata]KAJ2620725.1 splicing factor [Coemansia sp. RSA 1358]
MAEEIDIDALLDAPYTQAKVVVNEQKTSTSATGDSVANSELETANDITSPALGSVEAPKPVVNDDKRANGQERSHKHPRSNSRSLSISRNRHRSSRSYREHESRRLDDRNSTGEDYDRHYRYGRSPRNYDRDYNHGGRSKSRYGHRSSRRESPRQQSSSPTRGRNIPLSRSQSRQRRRSRGNRSPSPAVDESERDLRTVFAMQLSADLRRSDLVDFFSKAGRVRDAHIVSEKGSRRSRGVAYVEFYSIDAAIKAVGLSGERLLGVPIIVQPSEAQKNRQSTVKQYSSDGMPLSASSTSNVNYGSIVGDCNLLCVKRLVIGIEPQDLQSFFDLFGQVEYCHVEPSADSHDADGHTDWVGFVKYDLSASAHQAASKLDGLELFGARLRVRMARKSEIDREYRRINPHKGDAYTDVALSTSASSVMVEANIRGGNNELQHVLLLKNMIRPDEETEPDWRQELEADVKGECAKYGNIKRVHIDTEPTGDIYVKFEEEQATERAKASMDSRWFGGRKIEASLVPIERLELLLESSIV